MYDCDALTDRIFIYYYCYDEVAESIYIHDTLCNYLNMEPEKNFHLNLIASAITLFTFAKKMELHMHYTSYSY